MRKVKGIKKKYINIILIAIFTILPLLLMNNIYTLHIFARIYINFIMILGYIIILGLTKQFSLGQVAFYGIGAYTTALLTARVGIGFIPAMLISGLIAGFIGILIAIPTTKFKGPWLALVTFAFAEILRTLFARIKPLTGGFAGFHGIPKPSIFGFVFYNNFRIYYLIFGLTILVIFWCIRIKKSALGNIWLTVGDDEDIAKSVGINVFREKLFSFFVGTFIAGLAGSLYAGYANFLSPELFTIKNTIFYLTIFIVGGKESIVGNLISVIIFTLLQNYLKVIYPWDQVIYGLIIVVFVNVVPNGVGEKIENIFSKFFKVQEANRNDTQKENNYVSLTK